MQRSFSPPRLVASTYLRHKKEQLELSLQRRFGRKPSDNDLEAQHRLGSSDGSFHDEVHDERQAFRKLSLLTRIIILLSAFALAINLSVLVGLGSFMSSIVGAILSVMVGVAQWKLDILETFRALHNLMRNDINRFCTENLRLKQSVDRLGDEARRLEVSEIKLKDIAAEQRASAEDLMRLVGENRITLEAMKEVLRDDIVADLMNAVLKGENDESGAFCDREIQKLLHYLRGLPAVTINEELLIETIQKDRSVMSLLSLIHDIAVEGIQTSDKKIFEINETNHELQSRYIDVRAKS